MKKAIIKAAARLLLLSLTYQLVYPVAAYSLTTGPTQPEFQGFEPVGTTDMVDLFTGDFVYNIPLLDIDGYPINISYHSGIGVEQEASWVGLGWSLNPGVATRAVRGLPDDFNKELIEKELHIKPEKNLKIGVGVGAEIGGFGRKTRTGLTTGLYFNMNNYRGLSSGVNFSLTGGGNNLFGFLSAGANLGVNLSSQGGSEIDYGVSVAASTSNIISRDMVGGVGINYSGGFNSQRGLKDKSISVGVGAYGQYSNQKLGGSAYISQSIPIGLQNYVPVITNKAIMSAFHASGDVGGEIYGTFEHGYVEVFMSKMEYEENGSREGFGYLYLQNASKESIMDFTRDKDGMFNKTMKYLAPAALTYDVYSMTAQGSGGIFRPVRNDFGYVYDPRVESRENESHTVGGEVGFGAAYEVGFDYHGYTTKTYSGPDKDPRKFSNRSWPGLKYENVYFKMAGEATEVSSVNYAAVNGDGLVLDVPEYRYDPDLPRQPRATLLYYLTAEEAATPELFSSTQDIESYLDSTGLQNGTDVGKDLISRVDNYIRKKDQISEITQLNKDGSRYVYGIPVMNNIQKEVTFSIESASSSIDASRGIASSIPPEDDSKENGKGVDNYYSMTVTPPYANGYLLSAVLSTDYVDVLGDGPSDDDLGKYIRFNYSRKENDYRWRIPFQSNQAFYNPGFEVDTRDDKASYIIGSREQWYVHSIESKNFVAEFYVSERSDGKSATQTILPSHSHYKSGAWESQAFNDSTSDAKSYKLDSIKLFSKHDRYLNEAEALPIKTVIFEYDYSLCGGTTNSEEDGNYKMTLKAIYTRYGNSQKNLLSPYRFSYSANNPSYDPACKDKWGTYKANNSNAPNHLFPYAEQDASLADQYASSWHLTGITLPSGGTISIEYEADDYAYVQDQRAMEMFPVEGVGANKFYSSSYGGDILYRDRSKPNNFIFFKRKQESGSDFKKAYFDYGDSSNMIAYNFAVDIAGKDLYDQVRGYADVKDIGICPDDATRGYIELETKSPASKKERNKISTNPIALTALNTGMYYIPQLMEPGYDPEQTDLKNIVDGLVNNFKDFITMKLNKPIKRYLDQKKSRKFNRQRSFVRLMTPNLKKKGGGTRVKAIKINDSFHDMDANSTSREYGNTYDYTIGGPYGGSVSSGVASYEPLAGGEENPLRKPVDYEPNSRTRYCDPLELIREDPVGETLFPSPVVGYRQVTVRSIHAAKARSAQSHEVYKFYTAKDYPIDYLKRAGGTMNISDPGFFKSTDEVANISMYSLIMNDMHGKFRSVEKYANKPGGYSELISAQKYEYFRPGSEVPVLKCDLVTGGIEKTQKLMGVDVDVTIDSRRKEEETRVSNVQTNINAFVVFPVPIPLPVPSGYKYNTDHYRIFTGKVGTKVVQQYGILKSVETIQEGARFVVENELFNAETGDVIMTSSRNEYKDIEYTTTYPAYWAHRGMGPAYRNIGVIDDAVSTKTHPSGNKKVLNTEHWTNYEIGDEIYMKAVDTPSLEPLIGKIWVTGYARFGGEPYWDRVAFSWRRIVDSQVHDNLKGQFKTYRSGLRNMLNVPMQVITAYPDTSGSGESLQFAADQVISAMVYRYGDTAVEYLHKSGGSEGYANFSRPQWAVNSFLCGYQGNYRPIGSYVPTVPRNYATTARRAGTFAITQPIWKINSMYDTSSSARELFIVTSDYTADDVNWRQAFEPAPAWTYTNDQSNIKYDAWGHPLDRLHFFPTSNVIWDWNSSNQVPGSMVDIKSVCADAFVNSMQYDYNNTLPVFKASKAFHNNVTAESFEDFVMLLKGINVPKSQFKRMFGYEAVLGISDAEYYRLETAKDSNEIVKGIAHTGDYSLRTRPSGMNVAFPILDHNYPVYGIDGGGGIADTSETWISGTQKQRHRKMFVPLADYTMKASIWVNKFYGPAQDSNIYIDLSVRDTVHPHADVHLERFRFTPVSKVIDGWQLYTCDAYTFKPYSSHQVIGDKFTLHLPFGFYYDDVRLAPWYAIVESYVYDPFTHRMIAKLDNANFATFYQYDEEGRLIRINKETGHNILTVQEVRSGYKK